MKTMMYSIIALVFLAACGNADQQTNDTMEKKLTYLALGDSYTIGEGVDAGDRWPVRLSETLVGEGIPTWSPLIVAQTGWTTDELMDGIDQAHIDPPFDLVSLLIGVNNQYRGWDTAVFRTEFSDLLDRAETFAGNDPGRVLVLSIPDWGVTPFAEGRDRATISAEIDAFNSIKKEVTEKRGILFIDITGISRLAENDESLLAGDGLHPSGKMYWMWVEKIIPVLIQQLR